MTDIKANQQWQAPLLGQHLLSGRKKLVDLTRPLYEGMPMWFGHPQTTITVTQTHEEFKEKYGTDDGFYARSLSISEHAGTHTDAVLEYDPDGKPLDQTPLSYFYGPAVCLDFSHVTFDPSAEYGSTGYANVEDVKIAEEKLAGAGEAIREGDIVLAWFDYGDRWFPEKKFIEENPGFSWEGAEYLAQKGIVNLGTDCTAIDNSLDVKFSGHMVCKKYGIVNTENMTNLGQLASSRFEFYGLPLNLLGGTGSPIRAVAVLD